MIFLKRSIAIFIAMFVALSSVSVFAADFSDMPEKTNPNYEAIEYAVNNKIITGVDGKLSLDKSVTLAEVLTFISRVKPFGESAADLTRVTDISPADWYYETFTKAVAAGFIAPDGDNKLNPTKVLTTEEAVTLINKALGSSLQLPEMKDKTATRENVVTYLYSAKPIETATEGTENLEFTDLKAKFAQETMQVALGILPDGTSYTKVTAYVDRSSTDWTSGRPVGGSSSGSSRPSGGSGGSSGGGSSDDDDEEERPTEAPTEAPTQAPEEEETQPPTQAPTEPEPTEPVYGEYDGPIDNDKDNVIDDPFDDGWRPPGYGDDDSEGGSGGGGFDDEDDDFIIDDADDPELFPTEGETTAPTEAPTEDESEAPSENESEAPSEDKSEVPSENESEAPSEDESEAPSENESEVPTEDKSEAPSENESEAPSENESEEETVTAFSKEWWFD